MPQIQISPGDTLLDKYRVERVLGQGGMGFVVAVRHTDLDELFAIKLMLPGALEDSDAERRFLREARAAVRLKGEHAVRVHDVGRLEDGSLYMVMEHLAGTDLKMHLAQNGPLPVEEAVSHVLQACEGIGEAHDAGIIHRDIKPANLFLTRRRNGTPCIKVLDFGISKQTSNRQSHDLTRSGAMLGSPLYMSPEQMIHARDVDGRTDLWSLGVILYELLTGTVPFEGESFTQVVYRVTNLGPKPPRALRPELPAELEAVVMRCLEKDPEKRFESVDALATALRSIPGMPVSPPSVALADTVDQTTGAPPPRPSSPSRSGERAQSQPSAVEATTGPSTTAMSSSRDQISVSRAQGSLGASSPRTGRSKLGLGVIGAVAVTGAVVLSLRGSTDHGAASQPSAAPAEASLAETTSESMTTSARVVAPSPPSALAATASAALAPAPTSSAATVAATNVRPTKAAQPGAGKAAKEEPAALPSAVPAPSSSSPPRKHTLY